MSERTAPRKIGGEELKGVTGGATFHMDGNSTKQDGTGQDDTIHAYAGNDTAWGGDGNDKIFGNEGRDWLIGAGGADEIHGDNPGDAWNGDADAMDGGEGDRANDTAYGGGGDDNYVWRPGDGNDQFHGQNGFDTLELKNISLDQLQNGIRWNEGGVTPTQNSDGTWSFFRDGRAQEISGTFTLNGETVTFYGVERINIGAAPGSSQGAWGNGGSNTGGGSSGGQDIAMSDAGTSQNGTTGNDTIAANGGNDTVNAGAGNDKVFGNAGTDSISGGAGSDELHGDNPGDAWNGANDSLDGGLGDRASDTAFGGGGDDTYVWRPGDGNDVFHGQNGFDTLELKNISLDQLQNGLRWNEGGVTPTQNSDGTWSFFRDGRAQEISGTFTLNGETVTFYGVERIDIDAAAGSSQGIWGSSGNTGGGTGGTTNNIVMSDSATDQTGTAGNDTITANGGNDTVRGGAGDDKIFGNAGRDVLIGGAGADELHGDNPGDAWNGENDSLDGGQGDRANDTAFGGGGDDTYVWTATSGNDVFHGQAGVDTLNLKGITAQQLQAGLQLNEYGATPQQNTDGSWSFYRDGQRIEVSGTFTVGGATMTFYGVDKIKLI
jgi:Ca2+-binding RTX toxin-like protein